MPPAPVREITAAIVVIKAVLMTVVAALVTDTFLSGLILVIVSATLTGCFTLAVQLLQIKENRRLHERLDEFEHRQRDIAGVVGADKRIDDTPHEVRNDESQSQ